MPTTLTASVQLDIIAALISTGDLADATLPLSNKTALAFANGTGANQANEIFSDTRTLAASGTENLDLAGVLTDAFGAIITFTKIKALIVKASAGNANDVVIGGHATAACASFFGAAAHTVKVKPGGLFVLAAPDVNGYAVTAATADLLTVTNGAAGTGVTYDVIIIGTV